MYLDCCFFSRGGGTLVVFILVLGKSLHLFCFCRTYFPHSHFRDGHEIFALENYERVISGYNQLNYTATILLINYLSSTSMYDFLASR